MSAPLAIMTSNGGSLPAAAGRGDAGAVDAVRAGGGRDRGRACRVRRRLSRSHHVRHGRHLDRRVPRARRHLRHDHGRPRRRVSDQDPADRHQFDRRRRRQHRRARHRRLSHGRPALGRRGARALPATAAAASSRPSPTPTWCWAASASTGRSAARSCSTAARRSPPSPGSPTQVGVGPVEMAEGILRIAAVSLAGAIKEVSVMRGIDPRDFALLPFGGAGPLHAAAVADELGMRTVVVPPLPGNFSALGLLIADVRRDFVRTRVSATAKTSIGDVRCGAAGARARRRGRAGRRRLRRRPAAVRRQPRHALRRPVVRAVRSGCDRRRRHRADRARLRRSLRGTLWGGDRRGDRDRELSPGGVGSLGQAAAAGDRPGRPHARGGRHRHARRGVRWQGAAGDRVRPRPPAARHRR